MDIGRNSLQDSISSFLIVSPGYYTFQPALAQEKGLDGKSPSQKYATSRRLLHQHPMDINSE